MYKIISILNLFIVATYVERDRNFKKFKEFRNFKLKKFKQGTQE